MYHIRRGDLMEHEHWEQFWRTGNVSDYLFYKSEYKVDACGQKAEGNVGVSSCESDCADRDGTVYSARGGV